MGFFSLSFQVSKCDVDVDVGFVVDSSGSLRNEYHKEKRFIKLLADSFHISKNGSRGGIINFSHKAELSVKLSDYQTKKGFNKAVDKLPLIGYTTRIDKALKMAKQQLFLNENGGRQTKPKLLVLLTDGSQTPHPDAEDPARISEELRNLGIKVIVIGIGENINGTELVNISGNKTNTYVATNFDELQSESFVWNIANSTCNLGE